MNFSENCKTGTVAVVNDILTKTYINHIKHLIKDLDFIIATDTDKSRFQPFEGDSILQGMCRVTTDPIHIHSSNVMLYNRLNDVGILITELVCKKINLRYKRIERFMWNFYKSGEKGIKHLDKNDDNFYSILYSLNTSDGYLKVGDKKIYDVEDEAKIYRSNTLHQGFGPTKDKFRLNLNIILKT